MKTKCAMIWRGGWLPLWVGICWLLVVGHGGGAPPAGFALEDVLTNVDQPMAMRFLPDGRMVLIQKKGRVRICDVRSKPAGSADYANLADAASVYGVDFNQERGLLDLAIDPAFPGSPYVYVLYTPARSPDGAKLRVSRFTHVENAGGLTSRLDPTSEKILWVDTDGYDSCCHFGGGLDFGPDGNLWITTGDHFQGSYAASTERAGGSVHRIRKDGTIPADNPYADGNGPKVDSLFAIGLRNPFRARWDLQTKRFFIAEVGGNTQSTAWEDLHIIDFHSASGRFVDSDFGTPNDNGRYDGINFGWPTAEGLPPYTDFPGANVEPAGRPLFAYKHAGVTAAINGGVVYRGSQFPAEYSGVYFFADSTRDFLRYLKFKPDGTIDPNPKPSALDAKNPDYVSRAFDLTPVGRIVYLEVGPDGALYFVSFTDSGGSYGQPNPAVAGAVRRYVYDGGNAHPVVGTFSASPAAGPTPLAVTFTIAASDGNGDPLSYRLDPGDGSPLRTGTLPTGQSLAVSHTYLTAGARTATLWVSDGKAETLASAGVQAGTPPTIASLTAVNNNPVPPPYYFRFGDTYTFAATATAADGTRLGPESFTWSVAFMRPGNSHPVVGPVSGLSELKFSIPSQGQGFSGPVFYRCYVTVRDANGLTSTSTVDIFPEKALIHFTSVPSGVVVQVDGNTAVPTPFTLDTLINFEHTITVPQTFCAGTQKKFANWADGTATAQRKFLVPPGEAALEARYLDDGPCPPPGLVLDGLVVHLEADLNVGLQAGSAVATWLDQSGLGNDLVAGGAPQLVGGLTPSGKPALRFDGIDDKLERVNATRPLSGLPAGNADRTMFLVVRYPGGGSAWAGAAYGAGALNRAFGLTVKNPTGELVLQGWGTGNDLVSATKGIGAGWMIQSGMLSTGTGRLFKDGVQVAQFPHTYDTLVSKLVLGEEIKGLGFIGMDVAALLIYNRAMSNEELAKVGDYLRKKYLDPAGPNVAPTLTITAPSAPAVINQGQSITLSATASDPESGNLASSIRWSSNLDGPLGNGPTLSVANLSVGSHTITATVADTGSPPLEVSKSVGVSVLLGGGAPLADALVLRFEADAGVATSTGNQVTSWQDLSGRGNSLNASGEPQLANASTPSGRAALRFDGVNDKLERVHSTQPITGLPAGPADRTMFMVVNYPGGSSAWAGASYGTGTSNRAFGLVARHSTGQLVLHGWGKGNDLVSNEPGMGAGWMVQSGMVAGNVGTLFKDGVQVAQFAHVYDTQVSKLVIGAEISGLGFMRMDVAAVLVYNRALTLSERASVEAYLRKKYLDANQPPVVRITSPADGAVVERGQSVTLGATANDAEDGSIAGAVRWTSSIDGSIGNGATLTLAGLSLGQHTITASVTDSGGRTTTAAIALTVQQASVPLAANLVLRLEGDVGIGRTGTLVTGWADQSGQGNSLGAAGDPQLGTTPTGLPAIMLDGIGDKLERVHAIQPLSGLPLGNGDRTIFLVANYRTGGSAWAGVAYGTGASNQAFGLTVRQPGGQLVLHGWGTGNDLISNAPGAGAGWLVQSGMLGGGVGRLFKDGVQVAQFTHTYNTVQGKLVIGEEIKGLGFVPMDVAAVLIYNRALTEAERASVDDYLRRKYLGTSQATLLASMAEGGASKSPAPASTAVPQPSNDSTATDSPDPGAADGVDASAVPSLALEVQPLGDHVLIHYPPLEPRGDYHLHQSASLLDIEDPAKRIDSIFLEDILFMDAEARNHAALELNATPPAGFFRLFFVPRTRAEPW